ncbi:MAG: UbiA family prenyltransferase [Patescibacteria group bacterium]
MNNYLSNIFNKIENLDVSFKLFLTAFFSIVFLRSILEGFSDPGFHGPFMGWTTLLLHMPIWFASVFVWLLILLKVLTKSPIEKLAKVQLLFFPIILFPPLFDLIITRGIGKFLSYIFVSNIGELGEYFIRFFLQPTISLGIRLEAAIVFFVFGLYVYFKIRKTSIAIVGVFLTYVILFIFGSFPSFPAIIYSLSGFDISPIIFYQILAAKSHNILIAQNYLFPQQNFSEKFRDFFNLIISAQIFISLAVGLIMLFFLWNKDKFLAFIKNIRPLRLSHYWFMFLIGIIIAYSLFGFLPSFNFYNLLALVLMLIVIALLWLTAVGGNDIYDIEADRLSNPQRPLVLNKITISEAKNFNFILFLLSIIGALIIGYQSFVLVFFSHIVAFLYSSPPFRLKKILILNSFLIAVASLAMILNGFFWIVPELKLTQFPLNYLILALLGGTLAINFKDIKDIEGDKKTGVKTLPAVLGMEKGKFIIGILSFIAYLLAPVFLKEIGLLLLAGIFGIICFIFITKSRFNEKLVFLTHFIYIFSIIMFYWLK